MVDNDGLEFRSGIMLLQDKGYKGYLPENAYIIMPENKPYKKEYTEEQKENNRLISCARIVVEHMIAGIKILRTVKDKLRMCRKKWSDKIMFIACCLQNLRVTFRNENLKINHG